MMFELAGGRLRVMGTLHLLPVGKTVPAWVRSAYEWSEAVFVEHSPGEFVDRATSDGAEKCPRASPELLARLRQTAWSTNTQPPLVQWRRGAAVVMALASRLSGSPGADQALHDWCAQQGKPFGYIEQASDVLDLLDAIEEADWRAGIAAELARPGTPALQLQQFYDAWRKGRMEVIAKEAREGLFSVPGIRERMLTGRNAAWAAPFTEPGRRSLVAVGAAHLVGPGNFLEEIARVSGRPLTRIV
ncbi:TraB/GumN family protein [Xylophilus sp. GOD-11R]|uniref:TraB/GumN family protein n=1 Tax=Xylophilus sp. GOD-11R TaxID=3089814 RepID=UPI00298D17E8|nr:TraB/GumN family protein [Xylophilus sp. GOD-11R]WPB57018.1 TraB/GumN family protein [Xylophilus sp. GOD-11R]